jgi:hypothetical protein
VGEVRALLLYNRTEYLYGWKIEGSGSQFNARAKVLIGGDIAIVRRHAFFGAASWPAT